MNKLELGERIDEIVKTFGGINAPKSKILYKILQAHDFEKKPLHESQFMAWDMDNNCPMEKPDKYDKYYAEGWGVG